MTPSGQGKFCFFELAELAALQLSLNRDGKPERNLRRGKDCKIFRKTFDAVYTAKLNLSPRRPWGELSPEEEEIVCCSFARLG